MKHEPIPVTARAAPARHFGLDWLRIAAFALLIPYHAALVFTPGEWIVSAGQDVPWLVIPMTLMTPWRLALLFAVSGYAAAALYARSGGTGDFLWSRTKRLLIPLLFAWMALLPVEVWIREGVRGYPHGLLTFWTSDYWLVGTFFGVTQPSFEHLWFVEYLWGYMLLLGGIAALGLLPRLTWLFARLCRGAMLLWTPILTLVGARLALLFVLPEQGNLFTDWSAHSVNLQYVLLGFLIARSETAWADIRRIWPWAAAVALACAPVVLHTELHWGDGYPPHAWQALDRAARMAMSWSMILLLFAAADRFLNRDAPGRAMLAEAVFPAYILHQVMIVLLAWWIRPAGGATWLGEYLLILGGTLVACAIFYAVGRGIGPLRPLIGLKARG